MTFADRFIERLDFYAGLFLIDAALVTSVVTFVIFLDSLGVTR
jgi:hypothetical protein